jgi:hypothetical protein
MHPKACSVRDCSRKHYAKGWCEMHYQRIKKYGDPSGGRTHAPAETRFWRQVRKTRSCWLWTGKIENNGYGRFQVGGKGSPSVGVHRYSCELHHGPIPAGMVVMHSCDRRECVNPAHLSTGTPRENTQDMVRKGRDTLIGERNSFAKLTDEAVREIRLTKPGTRGLTKKYGVSKETIAKVRKGLSWRHVE